MQSTIDTQNTIEYAKTKYIVQQKQLRTQKKTPKAPEREVEKALKLKKAYYEQKKDI